jgi:hypothetical protein
MLLDLAACYDRLSADNGYFFRLITEGWEPELHDRLRAGKLPAARPGIENPVFSAA